MDRRSFLKLGGGLVLLAACRDSFSSKEKIKQAKFVIHIDSNSAIGHKVRIAIELPVTRSIETETLVVGAGIAGLAAACSLNSNKFVLCELDPTLGGTSGAININGDLYSQGAHYDLAYPSNYGKEGLFLLEKLEIIHFNEKSKLWEFVDKQYLISSDKEEACYYNGSIRESVLPNTELKQNFIALLKTYDNQLPLPSTLFQKELHQLDRLTFYDYLNKYLPINHEFIEAIDYQMLDDFGGTSTQISALAGIHYYKCRPYYESKELELFSPPQGNYYFIQKMAAQLDPANIQKNHLVFGLQQKGKKWHADVLDTQNMIRKEYISDNVIYAGQKHALKYIHKDSYAAFNDVSYAPWVVINIELDNAILENSKWQNDFLSPDGTFLGFVDSKVQDKTKNRVLTAYYCFPSIHHYVVKNFESSAEDLVHETIANISLYYKKDIGSYIKQVFIKLLGHAMPIPQPGYLTRERTLVKDKLAFAGVDTGRLPLMFDALDSGIQAAKAINNLSSIII
ncbi:MAG: NAD(P)-binding protein [Flavobacteriales bacterium]|nr:NAD(P)-binding protein [Flavobacteriales bacterium]